MKLIDANALAKQIREDIDFMADSNPVMAMGAQGVLNDLVNAPAIDAEPEIIRCGDCKHWNAETKGCNRNPSVEAWEETDYCSYWESKEV